jgi:hypothetical protein
MDEPKREAKKITNITSRRGSGSTAAFIIMSADNGECKAILETTVGIILNGFQFRDVHK